MNREIQTVSISVVVPTYNRADYIEECLMSILAQAGRGKEFDIEVLVVDDGSTDETQAIVERIRVKNASVRYTRILNTGTPGAPRNVGINLAKGEYIAFLDSDDAWKPNMLHEVMKCFADNDVMLAWCNAETMGPDGKKIAGRYLHASQAKSGFVFDELVFDNFVITSGVVVRKSALLQAGFFMENAKYNVCQDYDLWLRIAQNHKFKYCDKVLVKYRHHPQGISKINASRALKDIIIILKHQLNFKLEDHQRHALYLSLSGYYRQLARQSRRLIMPIQLSKALYFAAIAKFVYS